MFQADKISHLQRTQYKSVIWLCFQLYSLKSVEYPLLSTEMREGNSKSDTMNVSQWKEDIGEQPDSGNTSTTLFTGEKYLSPFKGITNERE